MDGLAAYGKVVGGGAYAVSGGVGKGAKALFLRAAFKGVGEAPDLMPLLCDAAFQQVDFGFGHGVAF